jgi:hypothetical protein
VLLLARRMSAWHLRADNGNPNASAQSVFLVNFRVFGRRVKCGPAPLAVGRHRLALQHQPAFAFGFRLPAFGFWLLEVGS